MYQHKISFLFTSESFFVDYSSIYSFKNKIKYVKSLYTNSHLFRHILQNSFHIDIQYSTNLSYIVNLAKPQE